MIRRALLAQLLVAVALAAPAHAAGGDTSAVAVNTKDGSTVVKIAFQIKRAMGDTVDNQNAAVGYSSCDSCQTVAISVQIVLVGGNPTTFTPGNYAIAINDNCTSCDTLASAYQFALGVDSKLKFTADGRKQIADIRRQLEQLRHSGLSGPEIQSRVSDLMGQLSGVLSSQTAGVNQPANPDTGATPQPPPTDTTTTPDDSSAPPTTTTDTTPDNSGTTTSTTPDQGTSTTPSSP
jgi:hypothetical protein